MLGLLKLKENLLKLESRINNSDYWTPSVILIVHPPNILQLYTHTMLFHSTCALITLEYLPYTIIIMV